MEKILLNGIPVYRKEIGDNVTTYRLFENTDEGHVINMSSSTLGTELDYIYKYIQELLEEDLKTINVIYMLGYDRFEK